MPGIGSGFLTELAPARAIARRLLIAKLGSLDDGAIRLIDRQLGREDRVGRDPGDGAVTTVEVLDGRFYPKVLFGGSIGAAEAYIAGFWRSDDLVGMLRNFLRNREALGGLDTGSAWFERPLHWIGQRLRSNTRAGSRRNIAAHYDLSNDFFDLWLDERMMYSSAIFDQVPEPTDDLDDAQLRKLDRLCRKLELGPDDHLLEIGTGWGGLAIHAAETTGCRVTTTTISHEQFELATMRIHERGLADRVRVLLRDYRDLDGSFDKLVSVEMVEAVGHDHLGEYFRVCAERLAAGGRMVLQGITIADRVFPAYRRSVDFIQRYIFPGGALPSIGSLAQAVASTDLQIVHLEDFGPHYAETLRQWRQRFVAQLDAVRALGFGDHFIRLWMFYFAYCEAGFDERATGDVQLVLTKPGDRRPSLL
ncbi:MAG: cyclopropane-fatty-acyl-phospholipid synthase family protein, partial [Acidobacteriota bacterium]